MNKYLKLFFIISFFIQPFFLTAQESLKDEFVIHVVTQLKKEQLQKLCGKYNLQTNGTILNLQKRILDKFQITNIYTLTQIQTNTNKTSTNVQKKPLIIKHADNVKYFTIQAVRKMWLLYRDVLSWNMKGYS